MKITHQTFILTLAAVGLSAPASATTLTLNGSLATDDQVAYYGLNVAGNSVVTIETTSYATGGFPTVITLFDPSGAFVDTSGASGAMMCAGTGQSAVAPIAGLTPVCGDALVSDALNTGTYTVALSEFPNFPSPTGTTIGSGFQFSGQGNFTNGPNGCDVGGSAGFYDLAGACEQRSDTYSLVIAGSNVTGASLVALTSAAIPEPASVLLTGPALLWLLHRRRAGRSKRESI